MVPLVPESLVLALEQLRQELVGLKASDEVHNLGMLGLGLRVYDEQSLSSARIDTKLGTY